MSLSRDGIADKLGVADNDPGLRFAYAQGKAKRGEFEVTITIQAQDAPGQLRDEATGASG